MALAPSGTVRGSRRSTSFPGCKSSPGARTAVGDGARHRQHHRHRRVHDAGRHGRRRHELDHRARCHFIGALLLGVLFGQLTRRIPSSDGGLYAYARHEFGDFAGYLTAWCYWITAWAGNAAIVSSWVLYVESLFSITHPSAWTNFGIAMTVLWIPAAVNLSGVRQMAWFQNVTVVLKFLPLRW